MTESPTFLLYIFNGWELSFHADYIEAVNPANQDTWRIALEPYADMPFQITMVEKGSPHSRRGPVYGS